MPPESQHQISNVLEIPESCQAVYFNGFSMAIGTGDVLIALQLNGKPNLVLNTSYTMAKTLAESLIDGIKDLEGKTNTTIMTVRDVTTAVNKKVSD